MKRGDTSDTNDKSRELEARLDALPRSIEPPADLWAGIATRIGEANAGEEREGGARRAFRKRPFRKGAAALLFGCAAAASIAFALTALRVHEAYAPIASVLPPSAWSGVVPEPSIVPDTQRAGILPEEESYRDAVRELESSLATVRAGLPPKADEALARDLTVLDGAIEATRAALAKSPDDPELRAAVREAYQDEIDVLSDVIDLCSRS
jgi:hypothetical protein